MKDIPITVNLTINELNFLIQLLEGVGHSVEVLVPKQYGINGESIYQKFLVASRKELLGKQPTDDSV